MNCHTCKSPLPPEKAICPTCGMATPYNISSPVEENLNQPAVPYMEFGPFYDLPGNASDLPVADRGSRVQAQEYTFPTQYQQLPSTPPYISYMPEPNLPSSEYIVNNLQMQDNGNFQMPLPTQPALLGNPVPPRPKRSRGIFITLVSFVVLVVMGGSALLYYAGVYRPGQLRAQATGTAQAQSTTIAHATGTAFANATATAVQVTASAPVTSPDGLQQLYTQSTSGIPKMNDHLDANSSFQWTEYSNQGISCAFSNGALHAQTSQGSYPAVACLADFSDFESFAYQITITFVKGDLAGLLFRVNNLDTVYYLFSISTSGEYFFGLYRNQNSNASPQVLTFGTSTLIKTGLNQSNLVTVIARGSNFYLYINKQFVSLASDPAIASGKVGVFAGSTGSDSVDVMFNDAQLWTL